MVNQSSTINTNEHADLIHELESIIDSFYYDSANDVAWDYLNSKRDYVTPELSWKLMDWVNSIDGTVPNLYEVIQISSHLTAEDINLVAHKITNTHSKYGYNAITNIVANKYPQYLHQLNYDELFAPDLAQLSDAESYYNIVEWMEVSDSVARKIVSKVAVHASLAALAEHLNDMSSNRKQYLLQYGSSCLHFLLGKSVITVGDIVEAYKISEEALIGVSI